MTTSGAPNRDETVTRISARPPTPSVVLALSVERAKSLSMTATVAGVVCVTMPAVAWTANGTWPMAELGSDVIVSIARWPGITTGGCTSATSPDPGGSAVTASWIGVATAVWRRAAVEMIISAFSPRRTDPRSSGSQKANSGAVEQPGSSNVITRVRQLWDPSKGMYWAVYQNVQSSEGSTDMLL
jgi:hypothetical protein